jgi:acyl carrier protein
MTKTEFLNDFKDILETEMDLNEDTLLDDIEEWDSLAAMSLITYLGETFQLNLTLDQVQQFKKISDILNLIGDKLSK